MVGGFVLGMPSERTNNFPESGRGLGHKTPTIFGSTVGHPSDSLASCLFVQIETGAAAKNCTSSYRYRKCLNSETFSCNGVSLKVSVKVSVEKYRRYFLQKYRY